MWHRVRQPIDELSRYRPCERFIRYYENHGRGARASAWEKALYLGIGGGLTVVGVVLVIMPVVPGFFLIFPGLALIAVRSRWAAHWLDRGECGLRRIAIRRRRRT